MSKQIRMLKKFFKGFSLVELIIVIAIIAILSVSAVMVLQKWIGESRDSRRLSDLETIKKSLTVNYVDSTTQENYPMPAEAETVTGEDGETIWYQGYFGSGAIEKLDNLNKLPKDPGGTGYDYSVTADQQTFEVYAKLENGDKVSLVTDKAYAEDDRYIAKKGNYDGYIIGTDGTNYNLYNSPSLYITSGTQLISGVVNNVYKEGESTDSSVTVTGVDITNLKDDDTTNDETVYNNIKDKFGLETVDEAEKVVKKADGDDGTVKNTDGTVGIEEVSGVRKWGDGSVAKSCNEYINNVPSGYEYKGDIGSGNYTIDPDGDGGVSPFEVYCDMTTQGGGWIKISLRSDQNIRFYSTNGGDMTPSKALNNNWFDGRNYGNNSEHDELENGNKFDTTRDLYYESNGTNLSQSQVSVIANQLNHGFADGYAWYFGVADEDNGDSISLYFKNVDGNWYDMDESARSENDFGMVIDIGSWKYRSDTAGSNNGSNSLSPKRALPQQYFTWEGPDNNCGGCGDFRGGQKDYFLIK